MVLLFGIGTPKLPVGASTMRAAMVTASTTVTFWSGLKVPSLYPSITSASLSSSTYL